MTVSRRFQHLLLAVIFGAAATAEQGGGGVRRLGGNSNLHENNDQEQQEGLRQLLRMDYADQPCTCQCTKRGGAVDFDGTMPSGDGVLVKHLKSDTDKCIRYGAVQRRIDRGRIECVPAKECTEQRVANAASTSSQKQQEMQESECPCTCARGKRGNHRGVWISRTRDGERQCARSGRAGRSIVKERAVCVPKDECPDNELEQQLEDTLEDDFDQDIFDDMYDEVFGITDDERSGFNNNNNNNNFNNNAAGARPSQTQMGGGGSAAAAGDDEDEEVPVCACKCSRGNGGSNRWGVWISTRGGPAECARNSRAGRSIEKGRSQCVSKSNCPDDF